MAGIPPAAEEVRSRMRAIADGLAAAGMDTRLHETHGCIDITATDHRRDIETVADDDDGPGITATDHRRDIEAIVDEDGHVELRYWRPPRTAPAEVCATIARAIAAIATGG
jgi:hypothetical protein